MQHTDAATATVSAEKKTDHLTSLEMGPSGVKASMAERAIAKSTTLYTSINNKPKVRTIGVLSHVSLLLMLLQISSPLRTSMSAEPPPLPPRSTSVTPWVVRSALAAAN